MRTSLRTIPPPDTFSRQTATVISLGQVRSSPRTTNEYVDSPISKPLLPLKAQLASVVGGGTSPGFAHRVIHHSRGEVNSGSPRPTLTSSSSVVVSQQPLPKSPPLKNEPVSSLEENSDGNGVPGASSHAIVSEGTGHGDSIICDQCGKCRCASCTEPRSLPSRWCCQNACEVSLDKALDVCTCFCCIKCMFYHCGAEEDNECYDQPCGCRSTPHCCKRWTVMGMVSVFLPCLWLYWPAKACVAGCTSCYNHCRRKGCQCSADHDKRMSRPGAGDSTKSGDVKGGINLAVHSKHSLTRQPLIESESSST